MSSKFLYQLYTPVTSNTFDPGTINDGALVPFTNSNTGWKYFAISYKDLNHLDHNIYYSSLTWKISSDIGSLISAVELQLVRSNVKFVLPLDFSSKGGEYTTTSRFLFLRTVNIPELPLEPCIINFYIRQYSVPTAQLKLSDLVDTDIPPVVGDKQVLAWNDTDQKWEPMTVAGGDIFNGGNPTSISIGANNLNGTTSIRANNEEIVSFGNFSNVARQLIKSSAGFILSTEQTNSADSGYIKINSGQATEGSSGNVEIYTGLASGTTAPVQSSGSINMFTSDSYTSGNLMISTGQANGAGSGNIFVVAGDCINSAYDAGRIDIQSGSIVDCISGGGEIGNISLTCGTILNSPGNFNGGSVIINSSNGFGTGTNGAVTIANRDVNNSEFKFKSNVLTSNIPTYEANVLADNDIPNKKYVDNKVSTISGNLVYRDGSNTTALVIGGPSTTTIKTNGANSVLFDNSGIGASPAISSVSGDLEIRSGIAVGSALRLYSNGPGPNPGSAGPVQITSGNSNNAQSGNVGIYSGQGTTKHGDIALGTNYATSISIDGTIGTHNNVASLNYDKSKIVNSGDITSKDYVDTAVSSGVSNKVTKGGDAIGATLSVGTTDNKDFNIIQNNSTKMNMNTLNQTNFYGDALFIYNTFLNLYGQYISSNNSGTVNFTSGLGFNIVNNNGDIVISTNGTGVGGSIIQLVPNDTNTASFVNINNTTVSAAAYAARIATQPSAVPNKYYVDSAISNGGFVTLNGVQTVTNKTLQDSTTTFSDNAVPSKAFQFECSGISTGTTRTLTVQDASGTIALISNIPTLIQELANVDSSADPADNAKFLRWNDTTNQWVDDFSRLKSDTITNLMAIPGSTTGSTFMDSTSKDVILKDNYTWYNVPSVPLSQPYNSFNTIYNPTLRWIPESISGSTGALVWPSIVGSGSIGFQGANSNFASNAIAGRNAININPTIATDQTRYIMLDLGAVYNGTGSFTAAFVVQGFNVLPTYSDSCFISLLDSTPFAAGNWDIPTAVLAVNVQGNTGTLRTESNGSTTTWTTPTQYSYVGASPTLVIVKYNHAITEWSVQINNVSDSIRTTNTRNFGSLAIRYLTFGWVNQYAGANACQMQLCEASFWNSALGAGTITSISSDILSAYGVRTPTLSAGPLTVSKGGSGATTFTTGAFLQGNGTNAVTAVKAAPTGVVVGTTDVQTLTNKSLQDSTTIFTDDAVPSKAFRFENSGITAGQTRILTVPDASGTIALSTTAFIPGGNTLGTQALLGTNDAQNLVFRTNNVNRAYFDTTAGETRLYATQQTFTISGAPWALLGNAGLKLLTDNGLGGSVSGPITIQTGTSLNTSHLTQGSGTITIATGLTDSSFGDGSNSGPVNISTGGGGGYCGNISLTCGTSTYYSGGTISLQSGGTGQDSNAGQVAGNITLTCGTNQTGGAALARNGGNVILTSSLGVNGGTNGYVALYSSPTSGMVINSVSGSRVLANDLTTISASTTRTLTHPDRTGYNVVANIDMPVALTAPSIGQRLEFNGTQWVNITNQYASIIFVNFTTPTQIATTTLNAWVLVNPTTSFNVNTGNFDSPSAGRIRFTGTGTFDIAVNVEVDGNFTTNARAGAFRLYKDGNPLANSESRSTFDNAGLYCSNVWSFNSTCTTNSFFEVYMANVANNSPFNCTKLQIEIQLLNRTA